MALFLLLFGGFMIDRGKGVDLFRQCSDMLHPRIGLVNTVILLTSSIAVALAVRAVRMKARTWAPVFAWLALLCALAFIFNKYLEWGDLIRGGIVPTTNRFFLWYFIMTGVHLAHVLAGTCVLIYMLRLTQKARGEEVSIAGLECGASYWHMVDLLWVILFPLLYLMR
ncbi:MAG: cytochrome c oxidase subunit 3 [candidate division KSB1 bacterium]|nr:cytochrome c oxidase subunit 3 [candidate division KSB1 bacterium]